MSSLNVSVVVLLVITIAVLAAGIAIIAMNNKKPAAASKQAITLPPSGASRLGTLPTKPTVYLGSEAVAAARREDTRPSAPAMRQHPSPGNAHGRAFDTQQPHVMGGHAAPADHHRAAAPVDHHRMASADHHRMASADHHRAAAPVDHRAVTQHTHAAPPHLPVHRFQEHMQGKIMSPDEDMLPSMPSTKAAAARATTPPPPHSHPPPQPPRQQQQPSTLDHAYDARFNMQRDPLQVNTGEGANVAEAMWNRNAQFNQKSAMPGYVS
jgi:hypothetical protein